MAHLRIIPYNALTSATAGGVSAPNLLNDYKSQTATGSSFQLTTAGISGNIAIVAMLPETLGSITMTVSSSNTTESTTSSFANRGTIGYGGGKYVVVYLNLPASTSSFTVTFSSSVKVSRFIVGNYWSPVYNTSFGMQVSYEDLSTSERLQSGDLYTTPGPRHKVLNFELPYLTDSDKFKLYDIVRNAGKITPIFISLFPEDADKEREQMYSVYGKFVGLPSLTYSMFTKYTSNLQLEEI